MSSEYILYVQISVVVDVAGGEFQGVRLTIVPFVMIQV